MKPKWTKSSYKSAENYLGREKANPYIGVTNALRQ